MLGDAKAYRSKHCRRVLPYFTRLPNGFHIKFDYFSSFIFIFHFWAMVLRNNITGTFQEHNSHRDNIWTRWWVEYFGVNSSLKKTLLSDWIWQQGKVGQWCMLMARFGWFSCNFIDFHSFLMIWVNWWCTRTDKWADDWTSKDENSLLLVSHDDQI